GDSPLGEGAPLVVGLRVDEAPVRSADVESARHAGVRRGDEVLAPPTRAQLMAGEVRRRRLDGRVPLRLDRRLLTRRRARLSKAGKVIDRGDSPDEDDLALLCAPADGVSVLRAAHEVRTLHAACDGSAGVHGFFSL